MDEVFGIDMTSLAAALVALLTLFIAGVLWIVIRRPIVFKMGVRNVPRRRAQSGLIVAGLMLSTLIITSALGVGDTVDSSLTTGVYDHLGQVDELVVGVDNVDELGFVFTDTIPADTRELVDSAASEIEDIDGVMPFLGQPVSVIHETSGLGEPRIMAMGLDFGRIGEFGGLESIDGDTIDLAPIPFDAVVIDETTADDLDAGPGDNLDIYFDGSEITAAVYAVARNGFLTGSDYRPDSDNGGLVMPLERLQSMSGNTESLTGVAISNLSGVRDAAGSSDQVSSTLTSSLEGTGLGVNPLKAEMIDDAETIGQIFASLFLVVGLFSIVAGILLILLIFTMLAAERRSEMGVARAIGTQRSQLVQQFISEGALYSLLAGVSGAALGVLSAIGMGIGLGAVFGEVGDIDPSISLQSVIVGFSLGVVITFLTVIGSSWRISRLNVVSAIRDLPESSSQRKSWKRFLWPVVLVSLGVLMTMSGVSSGQALPFMGGVSLLVLGSALLLRSAGLSSRVAFTVAGILLLMFWLLPGQQFERIFGEYDGDFEMFVVSGVFMVVSATLVLMQNDSFLLKGVGRLSSVFRSSVSSIKLAVAYPGASRGRTGMTVAMFSLIVFSIVMIASINLNLSNAFLSDQATGGWDVRADTISAAPGSDLVSELAQRGVDVEPVAATGVLTIPSLSSVDARTSGTDQWQTVQFSGMDQGFIETTEWQFHNRAEGYDTDQEIVDALLGDPGVAIIDSFSVTGDGGFGADDELLSIETINLDKEQFEPVTLELAGDDGAIHEVAIIGVLEPALSSFEGVFASQATATDIYGGPAMTSYRIQLDDPDMAENFAKDLESALLPYGVQGESMLEQIEQNQQENEGFFLILEGFMALGMVVGVAAIGVIAFRNVVERRQQIGVLRAIGFQRRQVSLSFLIESSFVVGLGVVSGVVLGLGLAYNLVTGGDIEEAGDIGFTIPWGTVGVVMGLAIAAALLMAWLPARQASRITPAEALRYE